MLGIFFQLLLLATISCMIGHTFTPACTSSCSLLQILHAKSPIFSLCRVLPDIYHLADSFPSNSDPGRALHGLVSSYLDPSCLHIVPLLGPFAALRSGRTKCVQRTSTKLGFHSPSRRGILCCSLFCWSVVACRTDICQADFTILEETDRQG